MSAHFLRFIFILSSLSVASAASLKLLTEDDISRARHYSHISYEISKECQRLDIYMECVRCIY